MTQVAWTCRCGDVELAVTPKGGSHVACYCQSCRGFATHLGAADILDDWGGSRLFQVAPEAARFTRGGDKVAWTRMTEKGPARWFTTCCRTPLANTLRSPAVPFLTLQSAFISDVDAIGPITMRVNKKFASGRVPDSTGGLTRLFWEFGRRALKSRITGGWRRNPLFDRSGKPVADEINLADCAK